MINLRINVLSCLSWLVFASLMSCSGLGCDPQRRDECEWYLVPEMDQNYLVEGEWVPLCARNYVTNKQKCYIRAKIDFAEKVYGKPFRYNSLEFESGKSPHKVKSLKLCQGDDRG